MSALEQEHRKRVWWTTICMDANTSIELSLTPDRAFHESQVGFPDNFKLSAEDVQEFSDPLYLTAQIKLCRIKYQIVQTVSQLRVGNADEARALIQPCLQSLKDWRLGFVPSLEFTEDGGFKVETLDFPPMRTLASLLLRHNQVRYVCPWLKTHANDLVLHTPSPPFVVEAALRHRS